MKRNFIIVLTVAFTVLSQSCTDPKKGSSEQGVKDISYEIAELDSTEIKADFASGNGNFFMRDSTLVFADMLYCKLFSFGLESGDYKGFSLGKGQGPNELAALMFAYPVQNDLSKVVIIDNNMAMSLYDFATDSLANYGMMDFKWQSEPSSDYNSPAVYGSGDSQYGVRYYMQRDGSILTPVSIMSRFLKTVDAERYKQGRLWGEISLKGDKTEITKLEGSFPNSFIEHPNTYFESFDYVLNPVDSTYYVTFFADPKIYVYDKNFRLKDSFGFENEKVDRSYTKGYEIDWETVKGDYKRVGGNTGIMLDQKNDFLLRTMLESSATGKIAMQGYKGKDLVLEGEMPRYFKLLGFYNGKYWGVRYLPYENTDDVVFTLYSFKIKERE